MKLEMLGSDEPCPVGSSILLGARVRLNCKSSLLLLVKLMHSEKSLFLAQAHLHSSRKLTVLQISRQLLWAAFIASTTHSNSENDSYWCLCFGNTLVPRIMVLVSTGGFLLLVLLLRSQRSYQLRKGKVSPEARPFRIFPVDTIMTLLGLCCSGLECQET